MSAELICCLGLALAVVVYLIFFSGGLMMKPSVIVYTNKG